MTSFFIVSILGVAAAAFGADAMRIACTEKPDQALGLEACATRKEQLREEVLSFGSAVVKTFYKTGKVVGLAKPADKPEADARPCYWGGKSTRVVCALKGAPTAEIETNGRSDSPDKCGGDEATDHTAGYCRISPEALKLACSNSHLKPTLPDGSPNPEYLGVYCDTKKLKIKLLGCEREKAWINGLRVAAWESSAEELLREIKGGEIKLGAQGSKQFCAPLAKNAEAIFKSSEELEKVVKERMAAAKWSFADVVKKVNAETLRHEKPAAEASVKDNAELKSLTHAAMQIAYARQAASKILGDLTSCELVKRSEKSASLSGSLATVFKSRPEVPVGIGQVVTDCVKWAQTQVTRPMDSEEETKAKFLKSYSQCYRGEAKATKWAVRDVFNERVKQMGFREPASSERAPLRLDDTVVTRENKYAPYETLEACSDGV